MSKTPFVSLYKNVKAQENRDISINDYISFIKAGTNQDLVLKARSAKEQGNLELYKELKNQSQAVTGSCTFISGVSKITQNISSLNGLIIVDIDNDQVTEEIKTQLQNDPYTYIMHNSFGGGQNYCIFVKIDSNRFEDSFENLAQYYFATYGITIDQACKNKNRLRFLSFDPDIFVNESSIRWKAIKPKNITVKPELTEYIFFEDDFMNLMSQIQSQGINLVKGEYNRYVNIGFALYDKFGVDGEHYFKIINEFNPNQNRKRAHLEWKALCKPGSVGIGTFYYYCKEAGLDIYSDKTKTIINAVKVSKSQGNPTIASVSKNVLTQGFSIEENDKEVIQQLIDSKVDYSKLANEELKEIEILENFILQRFEPYYNSINKEAYINKNEQLDDFLFSDVFITCKKHLDLKKDLTEKNVEHILKSKSIPTVDVVKEFFNNHYTENHEKGFIKQYAECILPHNPFNEWALKHWLVGTIFNWTRSESERKASPLTLVLTGGEQGIGKSTFIKGILPDDLYTYSIEGKIDLNNKDSLYRMATSLIMVDEEFGGKSVKDDQEFKAVAEIDRITLRRAYGRRDVNVLRICGLAGSSNIVDVLKDVTGNRRILPVNTEGFDFDKMKSVDKVKMLCEAYGLLLSGFDWQIYGDKKKYLNEQTKDNLQIIPFEEVFLSDFSLTEKPGTRPIIINQGDILKFYSDTIRATKYDVRNVVIKNKMENKSRSVNGKQKTGYLVYIDTNNKIYSTWYNGFTNNDDETPF